MIFKNNDEKFKKMHTVEDTDSFWDISNITPPMNSTKKQGIYFDKTSEQTVLVTEETEDSTAVNTERINSIKNNSEKLFSYKPDNCLIKNINIYSWPSKYSFYERFRLDAQKYFNLKHPEVQPVSYFSYMPGYIQMSLKQRKWYFYWRDCVRNKKYLETDSSYILLYIYEIINLPELISAEEGIELLIDIWEKYRKSYTKLDKFMSEWVLDYCVVNQVAFPFERISLFYDGVLEASSFKQFYINCRSDRIYCNLLFEKLSSYNWRKSKYINDKNREVFEKHIREAFYYSVDKYAKFDGRFDEDNGRVTEKKIMRDSFSGALCVYNVKRKIEIEYFDLSRENELNFIVTDMVRYCENKVRAYLGIRPRLSTPNLTEQQKNIINEYFDEHLPSLYVEPKKKRNADYEIEVEVERPFEVSFEKAREIEERSCEVTGRLIVDDDIEEYVLKEVEEKSDIKSIENETLDVAKQALIYVVMNDMTSFTKLAEECYMMNETLAECVNELCFEILGDVGIEEIDGRYKIISDYEQEIREWLKL